MVHKSIKRQCLATFTACLSMIGWGCNIGWTAISGPQLSLDIYSNSTQPNNATGISNNDDLQLNHDEISWMGASFSVGGLCGALSAGVICERLGRKLMLHGLSLLSVGLWLMISQAWNIYTIMSARVLLGFISSTSSSASALYVAEIAQPNIRGGLGNCLSFSVALGITLSMFSGAIFSWRIVSLVCCVPQIIGVFLWCWLPESPYFLSEIACNKTTVSSRRKKDESVHESVRWLMVDEDRIEATHNDIAKFFQRPQPPQQMDGSSDTGPDEEKQLQAGGGAGTIPWQQVRTEGGGDLDGSSGVGSGGDLSHGGRGEDKACCGLKLLLMSSVMAFSRLCGVTQYSYYMVDIIENTDVSALVPAQWASAGVTIFEMVGSLLAMFLCDRLGRRKLLMWSGVGMFVSNASLFLTQTGSLGLNNSLPIVALSLFYVSFTLGFGGLPFVILGEMFPPGRQKSLAISLSVSCIWILNFVNTKSYFVVVESPAIGYSGLFLVNGLFCILATLVVFCCLPETKNKTLAQVQEAFDDFRPMNR